MSSQNSMAVRAISCQISVKHRVPTHTSKLGLFATILYMVKLCYDTQTLMCMYPCRHHVNLCWT